MIELEQKSKPLSLKRNSTGTKNAPKPFRSKKLYKPAVTVKKVLTPAQVLATAEKAQRDKNIEKAQSWLASSFPRVFNKARIVPLEIGIHKKIMTVHKQHGGSEMLGFGWNPIKRALRKWTSRPAYQRLLTEESLFRRSTVGGISGEVTEEQAKIAKAKVMKMKRSSKRCNKK